MTDYDFNDYGGDNINGNFNGGYLDNSMQQPQTPSSFNNNNNNTYTSREQCLLPLQISQINTAPIEPDEPFKIDGIETSNVTIVAEIENIQSESITTTVTCKDSTGTLDVKIWDSDQKENQFDDLLKIGSTVRIIGRMKIFRNNISLQCYKIVPIAHEKEVKLHELEAQYAHEYNIQQPHETPFWDELYSQKNNNNNNMNNSFNNNNNYNNNNNRNSNRNMFNNENINNSNNNNNNYNDNTSMISNNSYSNSNDLMDTSSNITGDNGSINWNASDELRGLNQLQRLLYSKIRSANQTEEGGSLDMLVESFGKQHDINDIKDGIEHLTNEGLVYTTMDEEHFKTTE